MKKTVQSRFNDIRSGRFWDHRTFLPGKRRVKKFNKKGGEKDGRKAQISLGFEGNTVFVLWQGQSAGQ
jgi:hypothetical protein